MLKASPCLQYLCFGKLLGGIDAVSFVRAVDWAPTSQASSQVSQALRSLGRGPCYLLPRGLCHPSWHLRCGRRLALWGAARHEVCGTLMKPSIPCEILCICFSWLFTVLLSENAFQCPDSLCFVWKPHFFREFHGSFHSATSSQEMPMELALPRRLWQPHGAPGRVRAPGRQRHTLVSLLCQHGAHGHLVHH